MILLAVTGILGFNYYESNYVVASTISLDVNPSIEIKMNRHENVLEVNALNEDAKVILGDMDFKGTRLDVTINALIGSMIRNGYLSDLANSILISVDNRDAVENAELQRRLSDEISQLIKNNSFEGAVLSQAVTNDKEVLKMANAYGITVGKAQLIQQILKAHPLYTFDTLVSLSINELNLLGNSVLDENLISNGKASDKEYVGELKAKEIALAYINIAEENIQKYEIELDYEMGMMIYEVEVYANGMEYDVDINAKTGEVVHAHHEPEDDSHQQEIPEYNSSLYIGSQRAKEIALSHAGLSEDQISQYWIEMDIDDGNAVYEIEFYSDKSEYEYDIDAVSGEVLKFECENKNGSSVQGNIGIQENRAKEIALNYVHLNESQIKDFEISLEKEHEMMIYEIEFKAGGYEYEFEINASSGDIMDYQKEPA